MTPRGRLLALAGVGIICACGGSPVIKDSSPSHVPIDPWSVAEPVPRPEPRSRYGNPASYEVFGKRYHVLDTAAGYREKGRASWYGTKFHGRRTSSGEPYDMFALTAAHKTLPLPSYVRVTNLDNGANLIVRVNDRGPFHPGRIIDLSYTAAVRLGVFAAGSAPVEVVALNGPEPPPMPPAAEPDALDEFIANLEMRDNPPVETTLPFLQLGAFRTMDDCLQQKTKLTTQRQLALQVQAVSNASEFVCRVVQGPFATRSDADIQAQTLRELGYNPVISTP